MLEIRIRPQLTGSIPARLLPRRIDDRCRQRCRPAVDEGLLLSDDQRLQHADFADNATDGVVTSIDVSELLPRRIDDR